MKKNIGKVLLVSSLITLSGCFLDNGSTPSIDASTPETSTPEVSTPVASTPVVSTPETSTPEVSTPVASTPVASTPEVSTPEVSTPEVSTPDVSTPSDSSSVDDSSDPVRKLKEREERNLDTSQVKPSNKITESEFKKVSSDKVYRKVNDFVMESDKYYLLFDKADSGYTVSFINNVSKDVMFSMEKPAKVFYRGQTQKESAYTSVELKDYGVLASASLTSDNGSTVKIEDRYYYPDNADITNAINVQRALIVEASNSSDKGYQSVFGVDTTASTSNLEWFVPNSVFGDFPNVSDAQPYKLYRETLTGLPMSMVRDSKTGYSVSVARYQPVIDYASNSYACVSIHKGKNSGGDAKSSVEVTYPTRDTSRKYFTLLKGSKVVYDLTLLVDETDSFDEAMVNHYNNQFTLQDQRLVNTDIDECFDVINEDFKKFMLSKTRNGITSYGLPWRVTIENGKIGPASYQAGFVGQQIPCAYNMMLYGIKNNDAKSLENGMNIINFWVNTVDFVTEAGVPRIWYDGVSNVWSGYPTFTRMAVDAMEGLFDAYRLATAHGIKVEGWIESVKACAEWFVRTQNSDGSWYRCYNYQGEYYKGNESDIPWNPGDITRSTSKNNSTMPVRFLGKMYEFTNDSKYLNSIKKAGDFIYEKLYPKHAYFGGTCDNPDCMDKEAGVYAMYAYDTLYTLTKDEKWLECLEQAAVFTMSSVLTVSFKIQKSVSSLKAAFPLQCGYSDGLSYICCSGTSIDNYAAYIYYQLFRLYIYTGETVYYDMAEFIQQNTKSTMDWDGKLNYSYKSLTPEASTIYSFGYNSATDDDNVMGVWLPWQSAANAEPIAKMYDTFNNADVKTFENTPIETLQETLAKFGVGGNAHRKY